MYARSETAGACGGPCTWRRWPDRRLCPASAVRRVSEVHPRADWPATSSESALARPSTRVADPCVDGLFHLQNPKPRRRHATTVAGSTMTSARRHSVHMRESQTQANGLGLSGAPAEAVPAAARATDVATPGSRAGVSRANAPSLAGSGGATGARLSSVPTASPNINSSNNYGVVGRHSCLFGVSPADPWLLGTAAGVLSLAAFAGALTPARHAMRGSGGALAGALIGD
jgi:hypothetical protein